jgi:hypothetical protein
MSKTAPPGAEKRYGNSRAHTRSRHPGFRSEWHPKIQTALPPIENSRPWA